MILPQGRVGGLLRDVAKLAPPLPTYLQGRAKQMTQASSHSGAPQHTAATRSQLHDILNVRTPRGKLLVASKRFFLRFLVECVSGK